MQVFSIPRDPQPGQLGSGACQLSARGRGIISANFADVQIVDIGASRYFTGRGYAFVHSLVSGILLVTHYNDSFRMSQGWYGQVNPHQDLTISNFGSRPVRVALVRYPSHSRKYDPHFWDSDRLHIEQRPAGIKLRSLWKETNLPSGIGYEDVQVGESDGSSGLIPRHLHENSNAVWFVYEGEGYAAMEVDGKPVIEKVRAGSWGWFNAGQWHGLKGNMRFISVQIPDIEMDYRFEEGVEFEYPTNTTLENR